MGRQRFLKYYYALTAAQKNPAQTLQAFQELLQHGTDKEVANGLSLLQCITLNRMLIKLRDIYGEDIGEDENLDSFP